MSEDVTKNMHQPGMPERPFLWRRLAELKN